LRRVGEMSIGMGVEICVLYSVEYSVERKMRGGGLRV